MNVLHSVKGRLVLLFVAISTLSTVLVGAYFTFSTIQNNQEANALYRKNLNDQFDRELRLQTEGLVTSLNAIYNEQKAGKLTEEHAKQQAIDVIKSVRYDGYGYFFADNLDGVCVAHATLGKKVEGKLRINDKDSQGVYYMQEIFKAAKQEGGGYSNFSFPKPNETQDLPKRGFSMLFKPYGWVIATGAWIDHIDALATTHEEETTQAVYHQIFVSLGILAIIQFFIIFLAIYLAKSFAEPIVVATHHLQRFAAGDFSDHGEAKLFSNRKDEFGEMEQAFKALTSNMHKLIQTIRHSASEVTEDATQLSLSAEQASQVSSQVTQSITDVAAATNKQLTAVDSASKVIEQLSAGMEEVSANATESADHATKATVTAQEGTKAIENAVEQMKLIEKSVQNSAQVIGKLGERSQAIGQIVDTISGIAGQTNLLALNAAIEAARAGEQGRGFAVVAEEVRKLAEQSQEATEKIATLIGEIQTDTNQAVITMNEGTKEVETGATVVDNAGKSFMEIVHLVDNVAKQSQTIATTIQEMAEHTEQILTSIQDIDTMNKNVVTESATVSAATQEQSASIEEISHSSKALANMAQALQDAIQQFKI